MEPRIQYAQTADGASIAFATIGQGELPVVGLPSLLPALLVGWRFPDVRRLYERLAQNRMLVLYDGRGRGLFGDRGEGALRGFDDPVRLFEVRWKEEP